MKNSIHISRTDFDHAASQVSLVPGQSQELWRILETIQPAAGAESPRRFDAAQLAYYFGALIVMGSMGWFMTSVWESFGGFGIFFIAAVYALAFATAGTLLWRRATGGLRSLGGLLVTVAVAMTPLAIYGLQRGLGWWGQADPGNYSGFHEWIKGGWLYMELGTVIAGVVALRFVRFPFLTAPVAFALWYISMDLTPVIFGTSDESFGWNERLRVSLAFGLVMLLAAYLVDVYRQWRGLDYGFWLSLFGLMAFWGGLSLMQHGDEGTAFVYGLINVVLMFAGVLLDRRAFVVFGALGVNGYLGHLAWDIFSGSPLFPFALSTFGIFVIVCGVIYARRSIAWRAALLEHVPQTWHRLIPETARGSAAQTA